MQIGMIGLGRMGANMVRRLQNSGHRCVVYDRSAEAVQALAKEGMTGAQSTADFVSKLSTPRVVWLMLPAAVVDASIAELTPLLGRATSSSTAAIPITRTTSRAPNAWRKNRFIMRMSA